MKKATIVGLFLFSFSFILFSEQKVEVLLLNSTGYDIVEVYISPSSFDDWENDLLNGQIIEDGDKVTILVPDYNLEDCVFDIKTVDSDGDQYTQYEVELCSNPNVEITFEDYDEQSYDESNDSYDEGYTEGYKTGYMEGYKEAFSEAYKQGFLAGLEESDKKDNN